MGKGEKGTPAKPQENAVRLEFHTIVIDGENVIINGVKRRDFAKTIQNLEKNKEVEIAYTKSARAYIQDKVRSAINDNKLVIARERFIDKERDMNE